MLQGEARGQLGGRPAYYIQKALGSRFFGVVFAVLLIACFAYGFNALQAYNAGSALQYYLPGYSESVWPAVVGAVLALLTGLCIFGGVRRISAITSGIVPVMAAIYIALGLFITVKNIGQVPYMLSMIVSQAFDPKAMFAGIGASCIMQGIKRGLYSNEAGMGSAPNAAAAADVSHPVKQGLVQMLSVFIDTILICSTTAFMLLLSGVPIDAYSEGMNFVQAAVPQPGGPLRPPVHHRLHLPVRLQFPGGQLLLHRVQLPLHPGLQDRAAGIPADLCGRHFHWRPDELLHGVGSGRCADGPDGPGQPGGHPAAGGKGHPGCSRTTRSSAGRGRTPSTATTRWAWAARRSGTKPTPKSGRTEPNPSPLS